MSLFIDPDSGWSGFDTPRIRIPKKLRDTSPESWPHTTENWKLIGRLAHAAAKKWSFAPHNHIGSFTVILSGRARTFDAHRSRALEFLSEVARFADDWSDWNDPDVQAELLNWATVEIEYQEKLAESLRGSRER